MKYFSISSILITAILFLFIGCEEKQETENDEIAIPVKTIVVSKKTIAATIHTYGKTAAAQESKLSFKIPGIIKNIYVDEGESVKKGALLASLNLSEIEAQLTQAKNGLEKAQRDYERATNLHRDKAATLEQLQNAETALNVAKANLEIVRFNLDHSKIVAPANGKVLKKLGEAGELINAGYPLFLFGSTANDWRIRVNVIDKNIFQLNYGDSAAVRIDACPGVIFKAKVVEIGTFADPVKGTFEVELQLEKNSENLASGLVARVNIFPSEKDLQIIIPAVAVCSTEGSDAFVFIYNGENRAVRRNVKIQSVNSENISIAEGLNENDEVITEGAAYLSDSSLVIKNNQPGE